MSIDVVRRSSTSWLAAVAIVAPVSRGDIQRRSSMPVRSMIHSLEVPIIVASSWLVTASSGCPTGISQGARPPRRDLAATRSARADHWRYGRAG
jgi:hypothetical protein